MNQLRRLCALTVALGVLTPPTLAQPLEDQIGSVQSAFEALLQQGFTGVAMIAHDDQVLWQAAHGVQNARTSAPITVETQFDMASITKTITGMIAADLIVQGELSADLTVGSVFDDAPAPYAGITLHQLLTHSAGLVDIVGRDHEQISAADQRARLYQTELLFEPGHGYRYSNAGYSLVAHMLEEATGQSYDALVQAYLRPAGANATGYQSALQPSQRVVFADGVSLEEASWGGPEASYNLIGNGGLVTTAHDLLVWRLAYQSGTLVHPEAVALAQTPHQAEDEAGRSYYGYGLVVETDPDLGTVYWHNGGARRFNAHWRSYADQGITLIVLSNQWDVSADTMIVTLIRALFED